MTVSSPSSIRKNLESNAGFHLGLSLHDSELLAIQSLISEAWISKIAATTSSTVTDRFRELGIARYHELSHLVDHSTLWPKANRFLSPDHVCLFRQTSLFEALQAEFGFFQISDEDNIGYEEVYWRLVRPNQPCDVGPLHADAWFWELGQMPVPPDHHRVKVWTAIFCDPGMNGFRYVPGSHKNNYPYYGEYRFGSLKPQSDLVEDELEIEAFVSHPGESIIFHDRLLHGGIKGSGNTRVSLEFTIFVPSFRYFT
jgi:hypothetical protein